MQDRCASTAHSAEPLLGEDANTSNDLHMAESHRSSNLVGMALYACSSVFLTVQLSCAHYLGRHGTPVFVIIFAREGIITALAGVALLHGKLTQTPAKEPRGHRWSLLALRAVLGAVAICCSLWAVTLLDLGVNMVLTALTPVWVALLSPLALREQPSRLSLSAICVCIVAVAFVARPAFDDRDYGRQAIGISLALFQSLVAAAAKLLVRELRTTASPNLIVLALSTFTMVSSAAAVTVTSGWQTKSGPWMLVAMVGVFGYLTQTTITVALRHAAAVPAVAMSYLSVVSGLTGGYAVFGEVPSVPTVCGGVLICVSTLTLAAYER